MARIKMFLKMIVLVYLVMGPAVAYAADKGSKPVIEPVEPYPVMIQLEEEWGEIQKYLSGGKSADLVSIEHALEKVSQTRYNLGFARIRLFSEALTSASYLASKNGDYKKALLFSEYAQTFDPTFSQAYYSEAKANLRQSMVKLPMALVIYYRGFKAGFKDFWTKYIFMGNLVMGIAYTIALSLGVFILFLFAKYQKLIRHEVSEYLPSKFPPTIEFVITLFILLAPLLLTLRILWVYMFWMMLGWVYFSEKEKIITWILVILMLVAPMILKHLSMIVTSYNSPIVRLGLYANSGGYDPSAEQELRTLMQNNKENSFYPFLLGLMCQRREEYYKAKDLYEKAIDLDYTMAKAYNNLGNVYYALNNLDKAKANYSEAIEQDPTLAAPHFNLSKVYLVRYDFTKADDALDEAKRLDPELISYYINLGVEIGDDKIQDPDRILISVGISEKETRGLIKEYAAEQGIDASAVWNQRLWGVKASHIPYAAILVVVISLVLQNFRIKHGYAMICRMCGVATCQKCMKKEELGGDLSWRMVTVWPLVRARKSDVSMQSDVFCANCKHLFSQQEKSQSLRMERMYEMEKNKKLNALLHQIYSFLSPGLGFANAGHTWRGFILFWIWVVILVLKFSSNLFIPVPNTITAGGGGTILPLLGILGIILYYLATTVLASRSRIL